MAEDDDSAVPRDHEPTDTEHVERIMEATACLEDPDHKYPIRGEELATRYADQMIDLPNETESLGSVFDRLSDRRYEGPVEAREAVLNELTGEEYNLSEFNDERPLEQLARDTQAVESLENEPEREVE